MLRLLKGKLQIMCFLSEMRSRDPTDPDLHLVDSVKTQRMMQEYLKMDGNVIANQSNRLRQIFASST